MFTQSAVGRGSPDNMAAHAAVVRDDIASLLRMGAPLAQVETLYGAAAVRAVAREEFAERRDVKLGADLIGRSSSIRVAHLGDAYFVEDGVLGP